MGQPDLSFEQSVALAIEFGLNFLELRALEGNLDLPAYFQARKFEQGEVPVRVLGSSLELAEAGSEEMTTFFRFGELAESLRAPYIRVFGGGTVNNGLAPEQLAAAADTVNRIRDEIKRRGWHFEILLETHGAFAFCQNWQNLNGYLSTPLSLLWDSHHTWRYAGESPQETWRKLGSWVRHIHYKDSQMEGSVFRYVLPGQGEFPDQELFNLLRASGYKGGVSLEWEKLWHKELPSLQTALERFCEISRPNGLRPTLERA